MVDGPRSCPDTGLLVTDKKPWEGCRSRGPLDEGDPCPVTETESGKRRILGGRTTTGPLFLTIIFIIIVHYIAKEPQSVTRFVE